MKIAKGINVTKNTIILLANNLNRKDERIATRVTIKVPRNNSII